MTVSAKQRSDEQKDRVQGIAVRKIARHFKKHDRGQLAMFCGTGKTRTAIKAIHRLKSRVVVVCVPTLGLVSQWLEDLAQHGDNRNVLAVCSKLHNETPEQHGIIGATTDKDAVRAFAKNDGKLLIVSTYQSYDVIQDAWKHSGLAPIDLLIADEAHNTAGRNSKHMGLCLHDKGATVRKRLFMTATRRLYRGEKQDYNCMDDTEIYGDVVYELTIREAIDRGILADYEVHVINVYKDLSAEDLRNINKKGFESGLLAQFVAQNLMAKKFVKVFTFHNRVADATKFSEQIAEHGQWSRVLTGEQRVQDREQVLQEFRYEARSSLIASVNVLGEGIDVPTVDVVVFADRMTEPGAIQQRMGRGTRMANGKRKLRIILPICVSPKMSDSEVLQEAEESHHKDALHVIRALASYDPKFYRQVAEIDRQLRRKRNVEHPHVPAEDSMLQFEGSFHHFGVRLVPNQHWPCAETGLSQIEYAVKQYYEKNGISPKKADGVKSCPKSFKDWRSVDAFLKVTARESLAKLCFRVNGQGNYPEGRMRNVIDAFNQYIKTHGRYPLPRDMSDGVPIGFATWREVCEFLSNQGTSLSKMAFERGLVARGYFSDVSEQELERMAIDRMQAYLSQKRRLPRQGEQFLFGKTLSVFKKNFPEMYKRLREQFGKRLGRSEEDVLRAIVDYTHRHGVSPSSTNLPKEKGWCSVRGIVWSEMLNRAGVASAECSRKNSKCLMITEKIREFIVNKGKRPFFADMKNEAKFVFRNKPFGISSWPAFVNYVLSMKEK